MTRSWEAQASASGAGAHVPKPSDGQLTEPPKPLGLRSTGGREHALRLAGDNEIASVASTRDRRLKLDLGVGSHDANIHHQMLSRDIEPLPEQESFQ